MDKKFEDRLKERLLTEEHEFDSAAWMKYQDTYAEKKDRLSFFKPYKRLLIVLLFLTVGLFGAWNAFYKNTISNTSISSTKSESNSKRIVKRNQVSENDAVEYISHNDQNDALNSNDNSNQINGNVKTKESYNDKNGLGDGESHDQKSMAHQFRSEVDKKASKSTTNDAVASSGSASSSSSSSFVNKKDEGNKFSQQNESDTSVAFETGGDGVGENDQVEFLPKQDGMQVKEEVMIEDKTEQGLGLSGEQKSKTKEREGTEFAASFNDGVSENEAKLMTGISNVEKIDNMSFTVINDSEPFQIQDNFITVLKERKLSFYIGAGYITTAHKREGVTELYPYEPSVYKLGLGYKLSKTMSLDVELNINYQQYLNLSKDITYYNQTATNFWFYEASVNHRSHINLELPIILKYHLANNRLSIYSGLSISKLLNRQVNRAVDTNLSQDQLENLGLSESYNEFVNPYNGSFILGVELPVFKWLSLNARINKGILDISNDSFWETGNSYNDFFTFSTHINF